MNTCVRTLLVCTILCSTTLAAAELPGMSADGWYTWRVEAIEATPEMCCYRWNAGVATREVCNLGDRHAGFTTRDGVNGNDGKVQIYALLADGTVSRVRVLSTDCAITGASLVDLGVLPTRDSVSWLQAASETVSDALPDTVAAIAMHAGDEASTALARMSGTAARADDRKNAIFWLAETGRAESEQIIATAIDSDPDDEVREHAVFALSLLPGERGITALVDIIEDRDVPRDLREMALFWLAQSESDTAYRYIDRLLGSSADRD